MTQSILENLKEKYCVYNESYQVECDNKTDKTFCRKAYREIFPGGHPCLYDALLTGCSLPFAKSRYHDYTKEIESDIKTMVKLMPETLTCRIGSLRCRNFVPPLAAACVNVNIPTRIVKFLVQNGADMNATYDLNGTPVGILEDMMKIISEERYKDIEEIFKEQENIIKNVDKISLLTKENEELKKRIIQLECEPYRGQEFFKALEEEKNSGLLG